MVTLNDAKKEIAALRALLQNARNQNMIVINEGAAMGAGMPFVVTLACVDGRYRSLVSEEGESQLEFYKRAQRIADDEGAKITMFGGLPDELVEPEEAEAVS